MSHKLRPFVAGSSLWETEFVGLPRRYFVVGRRGFEGLSWANWSARDTRFQGSSARAAGDGAIKDMRVPLSVLSVLLFSIKGFVYAGTAMGGSQVSGVKRHREEAGTGEPLAEWTLPNGQAAELWAHMLEMDLNPSEQVSLEASDQEMRLAERLYQEFFEVLTRSIVESLFVAPPLPDLEQKMSALCQAFIAKIDQLPSLDLGLFGNILCSATQSTAEIGPLIDWLEEHYGWLRGQVFEDMSAEAKCKILDLLKDLLLQFTMNRVGLSAPGVVSCTEIMGDLEGELGKLENWQALEISKLISNILHLFSTHYILSGIDTIEARRTSYLLVIKYLKEQLPVDLREMAGNSLKVIVEGYIWIVVFECPEIRHNFEPRDVSQLSSPLVALSRFQDYLEDDLVRISDNLLMTLRFQAAVVELTRHTFGFPKQFSGDVFPSKKFYSLCHLVGQVGYSLNADGDPRGQDIRSYQDLVYQSLGRCIQACREYSHIRGLAENDILEAVRPYLPGFVPPEPEPRVPTKGAHNAAAEEAVPEGAIADPTAEAQVPPAG